MSKRLIDEGLNPWKAMSSNWRYDTMRGVWLFYEWQPRTAFSHYS